MNVTINTSIAGHYIEIQSDGNFQAGWEATQSPFIYTASGFTRIVIHRGAQQITWRVDGPCSARLEVWEKQDPPVMPEYTVLHRNFLKLDFHVANPLSPAEKGVDVTLCMGVDDGALQFLDKLQAKCSTRVSGDTEDKFRTPQWFVARAPWIFEDGAAQRAPSRDNRILSATVGPTELNLGNLIHIDPGQRGDSATDYQFAFVLEPSGQTGRDEVCVEFAASPQFMPAAPVSGFALNLDFASRQSVALQAFGMRLRCKKDGANWRLDWQDVRGGQSPARPLGALSLETLTQALFGHHALGLAATRSRNSLSIMPTWVRTKAIDDFVRLRFMLEIGSHGGLKTRLASIRLTSQDQALRLVSGGARDIDGKSLELDVLATNEATQGRLISWTFKRSGASPRKQLAVGAVLLTFEDFKEGDLYAMASAKGDAYRRSPLESHVRLTFNKAKYSALGMDPELGFETMDAIVDRPRPWTLDLDEPTNCELTIKEDANQRSSRKLSMGLKLIAGNTRRSSVIVVDPSPLTVVRVETVETQGGRDLLAQYIDDADQAPEWRFYSNTGEMTATLPPQGIGEEMVKGYLHRDRNGVRTLVPKADELFDFRLTPTAQLVLGRTDVDMARSEAPWSLRRLLSQRLGTVGVKLKSADFELLYGMKARLNAPGLRLAELDGFIGRAPYPGDLIEAREKNGTAPEQLLYNYADQVAAWQSGLWKRPSWWRVYADIANRSRLAINAGIEYSLRDTRHTADPFDIASRPRGAAADDGREALRGGVDWGFQSRSIYNELLDAPVSSGGSIEGLVFGTLGGEGAQTAAFNNGKTLIISNTRQGRLDSLTIIRVGRISMTWNKARHVIVYERTTRRAPRYVGNDTADLTDNLEAQPEFKGIAALRKVREYVEITEPRRKYPDSTASVAATGSFVQCVFASTSIPVSSTWGKDIPGGFVIALQGPVPIGKELSFPKPQVFLDQARAKGKGDGYISHPVVNTQDLKFFSSTRPEDGGDSDIWPAWPDVDFSLFPRLAPPKLPFSSSFKGSRRQPNAAPFEVGQGRFTLLLGPAEEAANLMHGRPFDGLEAKLFNVTLARGRPGRVSKGAVREVETMAEQFSDGHAMLIDGLRELGGELRNRVANGENDSLADDPQLLADTKALLSRLKDAVSKVPVPASAPPSTWLQKQKAANDSYVASVTAEGEGLKKQLLAEAMSLHGLPQQAALQAGAAVDAIAQRASQRVGEVSFIADHAFAAVRRVLDELEAGFLAKISGSLGMIDRSLHGVAQAYDLDPRKANQLEAEWRDSLDGAIAQLNGLLDILQNTLDSALAQFFSRMKSNAQTETIYARVSDGVGNRLTDALDAIVRWSESLPPFEAGRPDFDGMRANLEVVLSESFARALLDGARDLLVKLVDDIAGWDKEIIDAAKKLEKWGKDLGAAIRAAAGDANGGLKAIREAMGAAADDLTTFMQDSAGAVRKAIEDKLSTMSFGGLQGSLDSLGDFTSDVGDALTALEGQLGGTIGDLERELREQARAIEDMAHAGARQLEDWVSSELGPQFDIAKEGVSSALETLRMLAEGPVTDAMRAAREEVGYYLNMANDALDITRTSALFNDMGNVLNSLSTNMPFDAIRDRLMARLEGLSVRDLFPDFCGIKLTDLLPDLDVPIDGDHQYDWIRIQHGFDKQRMSAWARVSIDKRFDSDATLFDLGPVKLRLLRPRFTAQSDIVIEKDGSRRQKTAALLQADFEMSLSDKPMFTQREGSLSFDERGELKFDFDAAKLELAEELQFISEAVKALMPEVDGLTITPLLPAGISAELCLPLPDIGTGAFTLTGVTLNTHLGLLVGDGFEIRTGLWLSKPERPFGMAVLFLGGGGWFGIDATYKPPSRFVTRVSIGLSAGAFVAVNFGFARASAGILFTAGVDFYRDWETGSGATAISIGLIVWGEFSIMGIASASIRLVLRVTYTEGGGMVGTGTFSASIRICWCFTLRVNRTAQQVFSKPRQQPADGGQAQRLFAANAAAAAPAIDQRPQDDLRIAAHGRDYGDRPAPDTAAAVVAYFDTLAI